MQFPKLEKAKLGLYCAGILVTGVLITGILVWCVWKIPQRQAQSYRARFNQDFIDKLDPKDRLAFETGLIAAENNARVTIAQIIGGLVVLLGLYATFLNVRVANKNVKVTEEGKLTDRFSKAVEMLGSDKLDVRLGGIYALERIARDSQKDHWTVMEVLTAFVREQTKPKRVYWNRLNPLEQEEERKTDNQPSTDIQIALTVIGRRKWVEQELPDQQLNFEGAFLEGADFALANLSRANFKTAFLEGAKFHRSRLSLCNFLRASLRRAQFYRADLNGAYISQANLTLASFDHADLTDALLHCSDLKGVDFDNAVLKNTLISSTDLSVVTNLYWGQLSKANCNETTKLPPHLEEMRQKRQQK